MASVFVAFDVNDDKFAQVVGMVELEVLRNPNLSGAEIQVERGDFTFCEGFDEIYGVQLLNKVFRIIDSE